MSTKCPQLPDTIVAGYRELALLRRGTAQELCRRLGPTSKQARDALDDYRVALKDLERVLPAERPLNETGPQDLDDILEDRAALIALRDSLNEALGETPQRLALASPSPHMAEIQDDEGAGGRDAFQDQSTCPLPDLSTVVSPSDYLYSRDHLTIIIENKLQRAIIEPPGYNNQPVYTVRCAYTKRPLFHSADQALVRMYIDGHYPDHTIQQREIVPQLAPAGQPSTHKVLRKRPRR